MTDSNVSDPTKLSTGDEIRGTDVHDLPFVGRLSCKPYLFDPIKRIWLIRLEGGRQFLSIFQDDGSDPKPNFTSSDGFEARI